MSSVAELYNLLDQQTRERALKELLAFTIYVRAHYIPNWHHRELCRLLDLFVLGQIKRLMVFMPPRHGKSELVSRCLPAHILGKNPDANIIATSYSAGLASRMNRDVQRIIDSPNYAAIFPGSRLNTTNVRTVAQGTWLRNSSMFEIVGKRGSYRCAGVGGGITGEGADYGIIDDPIKNQEEAYSVVYRDKVWDWYVSTFYTRLEGADARILLTLTRWHEDDLAGRLLKQAREDPNADQWYVFNLPAVRENVQNLHDPREPGEALWPDKFPLELLEKNKAQGEYFWNALYQQRPSPLEGGMVKREWLRYYTHIPKRDDGSLDLDDWLTSWDMSFKKTQRGSWVVGQIWGRNGANFYLVDQFRNRVNFPQTLEAVRRVQMQYPQATTHLVESAANGPAVIDSLRDEIPGLIPIAAKDSKEARLAAVSSFFESGNVYVPDPSIAPWVKEFVEEVITFPNGPDDDQVDSCTQALNRYKRAGPPIFKLNMSLGTQRNPWSLQ